MVNAQEYINNNFPKHVDKINAIGKNLEGDLDLSGYLNLTHVDIGDNPNLRSLKLCSLSKIVRMSIYETGISDFSFLADMPNVSPNINEDLCLPHIDRLKRFRDYQIGQVVRDINRVSQDRLRAKEQQIQE